MSKKPKKIFLISPVSFDSKKEEKKNLRIVEGMIGFFRDFDFEVIDMISLLKEANKKKNNLIVKEDKKTISDHAWVNFCLFRYLCSNMVFCDYVAMAGNVDGCAISASLCLNSLIMQMPVIVPVVNSGDRSVKVEAGTEILLPYIDYEKIQPNINGSAWGSNQNCVDIENSGNIPPIDKDLGSWFNSQFPNKGEKP